MSYIEKNILLNGETIVKRIKLNPARLILAWIWGILGCWLLLIPTFKAIKASFQYSNSEQVITNYNVIKKSGTFSIRCDELKLDKIEDVRVEVTFWGRVFKYGNVYISASGRNSMSFIGVKHAEDIRKFLTDSVNNCKR